MIRFAETALKDGHKSVALIGEADIYTASAIKEKLFQAVAESTGDFYIDLKALKYIDSTGLGILVGVLKRVRERGGNVVLLNPQPQVRKLLRITSFDKVFLVKEAHDE